MKRVTPIALVLGLLPSVMLAAPIAFTDQTAGAGLGFTTVEADATLCTVFAPGGAVGDFNRDGWPDLFVLGGGGAGTADALFINNGNGTFTDQAASWGVDLVHRGHGVAVGDYDGDGWLDIYVTSSGDLTLGERPGQHLLYRNTGSGTFVDMAVSAGVHQTSALHICAYGGAFGDYDLDGDLDLYVPTWGALNDGSRLFRNEGDGTFTDQTVTAGMPTMNLEAYSARFADMNGDRYPELLIAADFYTSRYMVNDGDGTFTDGTASSGTSIETNGMGQTLADFNNDLLLDWYVTSIFNSSGEPDDGNMVYINQGGDSYSVLPQAAGAKDGAWSWGAEAADFNHDGYVDIGDTNGFPGFEWDSDPSYIYRNNGDLTFTEVHVSAGVDYTEQGRSLILIDYDKDGDMDMVIVPYNGPIVLYRNDVSGTGINWLEVELDTSAATDLAPDGYGARVTATAGAESYLRVQTGGLSFAGQSELLVHFGLGAATQVDQLQVEWSNGTFTTLTAVPVNQRLTLSPPAASSPGEASADGQMTAAYDTATGRIDITYVPACDSTNHTIYYGDLADVPTYGFTGAECMVGSSGSAGFIPAGTDDLFFMIVGNTGDVEGSYGVDGTGSDRPEDILTLGCDLPQDLSGTCDL